MSNDTSTPSLQDGSHSQTYEETQELSTPSRSGAGKGRKPRNSRSQRHPPKPKQQSSSVNNSNHIEPLTADQNAAYSAAGEDSQDSTPQHNSGRQRKRNGKTGTPNRQRDYNVSAIPAFDGTSSPRRDQTLSRPTSSQVTQATPIKQAYAGPTFHASPAASSLPIPKFLSKSVPAAEAHQTHSVMNADFFSRDSPAREGGPDNAGYFNQQPPLLPPPRHESPLDLLFNAHRAEQAREKGSHSTGPSAQRLQTPESAGLHQYRSSPRPGSQSSIYEPRNSRAPTDKNIFMMELDGTGDSETSEDGRPSVPFRDRLGATRSTSSLSVTQTNENGHQDDETQHQAKSQALKNLLMQQRTPNVDSSQPESSSFHHGGTADRRMQEQQFSQPPSHPHGTPQREPATTAGQTPSAASLRAMEDDLCRILKLNREGSSR